jgi:hypothetical protein
MEATAKRTEAAVAKLKSRDCIPHDEGYRELGNVLKLLKLDRHDEAQERLEHWLNRNDYYWRMFA